MSTSEAYELAVQMRPEGIGETQSGLEGVGGQFDETAGSVGDSASEMEGFSQAWAGAMSAIVAGLAVAAAGLLTQVPVIGELMASLVSVIQAVAFQMDGVLRPVITPLADFFYQLSAAIFEAEGIMGTIIGVVASVAAILTTVVGVIAAVGAQLGVFASTGAGVISILGSIASAIGTVVGIIAAAIASIGALAAAVVVAVAAIVAFAAAYLTNFRGVRDKTDAFVADMAAAISGFVSDAVSALAGLAGDALDWMQGMASNIGDVFTDLLDSAREWGASLITRLVEGIRSMMPNLQGMLNQNVVAGVSVGDVVGGIGSGASAAGQAAGSAASQARQFGAQRNVTITNQMDGRRVDRATGRYGKDRGVRRGL
ncbi:hypothetical protein [Halorarum salinum]|uniref:Uncharacterized protein n=1 Tax=Halorarum salinum TaxID=2743089 RepID=A0A7D5LCL0_9EURY|nr:hypothetical protein [Halobaculum salinum]QLG62835.1 hypothetical protein HUG12_14300 [Halobaculum salinum]